jgi:hypothetical protein
MESDDTPRPEDYVPKWPDGTPKAEQYWNDVEKAQVETVKQSQEEWDAAQEPPPEPEPEPPEETP